MANTVGTGIRMPRELFDQAQAAAKTTGQSFNQFICTLIESHIARTSDLDFDLPPIPTTRAYSVPPPGQGIFQLLRSYGQNTGLPFEVIADDCLNDRIPANLLEAIQPVIQKGLPSKAKRAKNRRKRH